MPKITHHQSAEILVVRDDGALLLQHRDDIPGIANPGCYTSFGGTVEPDEDLHAAAVRELNEETNLNLSPSQLRLWRSLDVPAEIHGFPSTAHYFITPPLVIENFEIYEGQGFEVVPNLEHLTRLKMSVTARKAISAYFAERPTFDSLQAQ